MIGVVASGLVEAAGGERAWVRAHTDVRVGGPGREVASGAADAVGNVEGAGVLGINATGRRGRAGMSSSTLTVLYVAWRVSASTLAWSATSVVVREVRLQRQAA